MKKFLLMGFALVVCLVSLTGCGKKEENNDKKDNTTNKEVVNMGPFELSAGDLSEVTLNKSLKLTETKFGVSDDRSYLSSSITNVTDKDIKIYELHISIKDSTGNEIIMLIARIDDLKAGETKHFETAVASKIENYKTIQYKIVEKAE